MQGQASQISQSNCLNYDNQKDVPNLSDRPSQLLTPEEDPRLVNPHTPSRIMIINQNLQSMLKFIRKIKETTYYRNLSQLPEHVKILIDDQGSDCITYQQHISHHNTTHEIRIKSKKMKKRSSIKTPPLRVITILRSMITNNKITIQQRFYKQFRRAAKITIHPKNPILLIWNALVNLILIHMMFSVPMNDTFQHRFTVNECINLTPTLFIFEFIILFLDILIQMNVSTFDKGMLIKDKKKIFKLYMTKNGLIIDVLTLVSLITFRNNSIFFGDCSFRKEHFLVEIIKYIVFLKLKKIGKFIKFIQKEFAVIKNYIDLLRLLIILIITAHLIACIWIAVALNATEYFSDSWILNPNSPWTTIYTQSMYFAVMTMTTVGYGDIVPRNPIESITAIIIMLFACGFFAYALNTITQILITISNEKKQYKQEMEIIETYMRKKKIEFNLQSRVKTYLKTLWKAGLGEDNQEEERVISKLNIKLQKELMLQDKGTIFLNISVFRKNFTKPFILKLIEKIKEIRLQPNEELSVDSLTLTSTSNFYYVHQGKVEFVFPKQVMAGGGKQQIKVCGVKHLEIFKLLKGEHFGTQYLFGKKEICNFNIKSKDFTIIYYLTPQDFQDVIQSKEFNQSMDNENYCLLRDGLLLYNSKSPFSFHCFGCQKKGHDILKCPTYQFVPNLKQVMRKYDFSHFQERNKYKRKFFRSKCIQNLKLIAASCEAFKSSQDEETLTNTSQSSWKFCGEENNQTSFEQTRYNTKVKKQKSEEEEEMIILQLPEKEEKLNNQRNRKRSSIYQVNEFYRNRKASISPVGKTPKKIIAVSPLKQVNKKLEDLKIDEKGEIKKKNSHLFEILTKITKPIVEKSFAPITQGQIQILMDFEKVHEYLNYFPQNNITEIIKKMYFKGKKKRKVQLSKLIHRK